jgi:hypothetical protein
LEQAEVTLREAKKKRLGKNGAGYHSRVQSESLSSRFRERLSEIIEGFAEDCKGSSHNCPLNTMTRLQSEKQGIPSKVEHRSR